MKPLIHSKISSIDDSIHISSTLDLDVGASDKGKEEIFDEEIIERNILIKNVGIVQ